MLDLQGSQVSVLHCVIPMSYWVNKGHKHSAVISYNGLLDFKIYKGHMPPNHTNAPSADGQKYKSVQLVCDFVTNAKETVSLPFSRTRLSEIDNNVHKQPLAGKSKQAKSAAC